MRIRSSLKMMKYFLSWAVIWIQWKNLAHRKHQFFKASKIYNINKIPKKAKRDLKKEKTFE